MGPLHTLTTIVATVIANAVVTGIIVYLIQKRIERSYTRQMEEFKASLQLSNFEQQTKFVKLHEKRVETLYRMFLPISSDYNNFTIEELYSYSESIPMLISIEKKGIEPANASNLRVKLDDFWNYFTNNRLFFSDRTIHEIESIYRKTKALIQIVNSYVIMLFNYGNFGTECIHDIDKEIKMLGLKLTQIDKQEDFLVFVRELAEEMNRQTEKLEKLYKSVGEAK